VQISTPETNKNVLSKICRLAQESSAIHWSSRALDDIMLTEGLSQKGVLEAIAGHINAGRKVKRGMTRNVSEYVGMTIFEMLIDIDGVVRYIKVQLRREKDRESLIVISAHDSTKEETNE
jgi:hypothetical protein